MIQVPTLIQGNYWQIYFYANTYNTVVGSGNEKYWIDLLKQDDTHKPCIISFDAINACLPNTSKLNFKFLPDLFNSYYGSTITADNVIRQGRGVFVIVKSSGLGGFWIWHGRITDVKKNIRIWEVSAISEFDFRMNGIPLTKSVSVTSETVDYHTKSDSGTILKKIITDNLLANPTGLNIYTLYPSPSEINISFDKNNGCGLAVPDAPFYTAYPPCDPGSALQYKTLPSLIDNMITKRKYKMFTVGDYSTTADTDYGFVPYSVPKLSRVLHQIVETAFKYGTGTNGNLCMPIEWKTFSPPLINKVTIENTSYRKNTVEIITTPTNYLRFGDGNPIYPYKAYQELTTGSETIGAVLSGMGISPDADNLYRIYGIGLRRIRIEGVPYKHIDFFFEYKYDNTTYNTMFRALICGQLQEENETYPNDNTIRVFDNVVLTEQHGGCSSIPKDATEVKLWIYLQGAIQGYTDPGGKWDIGYYSGGTDLYTHGELYYIDHNGDTHHSDYMDLCFSLYIGTQKRIYEAANEASIAKYGLKNIYIRNPLNILEPNISNFANRLLKYSDTIPNEGEVTMGATITPKRLYDLPTIASQLCYGIKVYDKANNIGTETNPAIFMLEKSEFVFPQCTFKLHLAKIPHGEEYLLFDKIRNVQDDLVQNL